MRKMRQAMSNNALALRVEACRAVTDEALGNALQLASEGDFASLCKLLCRAEFGLSDSAFIAASAALSVQLSPPQLARAIAHCIDRVCGTDMTAGTHWQMPIMVPA